MTFLPLLTITLLFVIICVIAYVLRKQGRVLRRQGASISWLFTEERRREEQEALQQRKKNP